MLCYAMLLRRACPVRLSPRPLPPLGLVSADAEAAVLLVRHARRRRQPEAFEYARPALVEAARAHDV